MRSMFNKFKKKDDKAKQVHKEVSDSLVESRKNMFTNIDNIVAYSGVPQGAGVGLGTHCSPRHRSLFTSRNEGSKHVGCRAGQQA